MEKRKIKLLSYNIHKGFAAGNRAFVLSQIRDAISKIHPDIVLLQEVLGKHDRHSRKIKNWPSEPQFEYLAHSIWPHYSYGKNAVYSGGHHGNAILSKYPIEFAENIDISTNRVEKRGLLHVQVSIPRLKMPLHLMCVHLGLLEKERIRQVDQLCDRIISHVPEGEPLILGGDFNDWRERVSPRLNKRLEVTEVFEEIHGAHARTFPSWFPALKLDRLYIRGVTAKMAKCMTGEPWSKLSDHIALYSEFSI